MCKVQQQVLINMDLHPCRQDNYACIWNEIETASEAEDRTIIFHCMHILSLSGEYNIGSRCMADCHSLDIIECKVDGADSFGSATFIEQLNTIRRDDAPQLHDVHVYNASLYHASTSTDVPLQVIALPGRRSK
jgi:hypothetical protein